MKKNIINMIALIMLVIFGVLYSVSDVSNRVYDKFYDSDMTDYAGISIAPGGQLEQTFVAEEDRIDGISIKTSVQGDVSQLVLRYKVIETATGETKAEGRMAGAEVLKDKFTKIKFDGIEAAKGKEYSVLLTEENAEGGNAVNFYSVPSDGDNRLTINGETRDGAALMRTLTHRFNSETFIVVLLFAAYIVIFMKILYRLFN